VRWTPAPPAETAKQSAARAARWPPAAAKDAALKAAATAHAARTLAGAVRTPFRKRRAA
jgi:hypothetical protein